MNVPDFFESDELVKERTCGTCRFSAPVFSRDPRKRWCPKPRKDGRAMGPVNADKESNYPRACKDWEAEPIELGGVK